MHKDSAALAQFLQLSEKMLECAHQSDWDSLPELEQERTDLMHRFFSTPADSSQSSGAASFPSQDEIAQTIKAVLSINEKIKQLAKQQQVVIREQLYDMKKKQNVRSAYLKNK